MEQSLPTRLFSTIPTHLCPPHWQAISAIAAPSGNSPVSSCPLSLTSNDVHLWTVNLAQSPDLIAHLATVLSATEQQRANQFYFPQDSQRFIVGRGMLRQILSVYLGIAPPDVEFGYGDRGKPHVIHSKHSAGLQFNLAHSHDLAVYAIARDRQIGVDLERVRVMPKASQLAKRFFSEREFQLLQSLPADVQGIHFLRYWTCKEAYVKACGVGLALSTRTIEIGLAGDTAELLSLGGDRQVAQHWSLRTLSLYHPEQGWQLSTVKLVPPDLPTDLAALAVEGRDWQLTCLPYL